MCRPRPGPRCSDYASSTLNITKRRLERNREELARYEEKYAESLNKEENVGARDEIRRAKHARLQEVVANQEQSVAEAQFEYHATPAGQKDLEAQIVEAQENGNEGLVQELTARKEAGEEYRKSQHEALKKITQAEQESPEAAAEASMEVLEQAQEAETTALIGLQQSTVELEAARAQQAEYERAMEEYRKNDRIDTPEEEAEKARRKKLIMAAIIIAGAGVLAYSLAAQAASGQKSSILQYGRSMAMRQAMIGGRRVFANVMQGSAKEDDARERRGEVEAERRALKAREKVYQKAEQDKLVADRNAAREAERAAELQHRQALREADREAAARIRQEEIAHYNELAGSLSPEVLAEINKQRREASARKRAEAKAAAQTNQTQATTENPTTVAS